MIDSLDIFNKIPGNEKGSSGGLCFRLFANAGTDTFLVVSSAAENPAIPFMYFFKTWAS